MIDATPLVSIDLIVRNAAGGVLLGLRKNRPAQGVWFVPGGRICKGERLDAAFKRICLAELGVPLDRSSARWRGVYEHLYDDSVFGQSPQHPTTHYVVLAYELTLLEGQASRSPLDQHTEYRWQQPATICHAADVHPNTQAYFRT